MGKINEYAVKIEFQECGLPHAHSLVWMDGVPNIAVDNDGKFVHLLTHMFQVVYLMILWIIDIFLDWFVNMKHTCIQVIVVIIIHVLVFQRHLCHILFICWEIEDDQKEKDLTLQNACDMLSRVHDAVDNVTNSMTMDDVLAVLGISEDTYVQSLKMSWHGRSVILHFNQSDVYTNSCNHEILHL